MVLNLILHELDSKRSKAEGDVARQILDWANRRPGLEAMPLSQS